jgi:hypothetical protein
MMDDQNPLRSKLEKELKESEWLQKFKAINQLLQTLKAEVPLTRLCDLKWDTAYNQLLIHCPDPEIRDALANQSRRLARLTGCAQQLVLRHSEQPDVIITPCPGAEAS